jgi:hypothetical protein
MKLLVKVTLIGAWDFERMKSHAYMKKAILQGGAFFWVWNKGRRS